jgi:hypothetical protein
MSWLQSKKRQLEPSNVFGTTSINLCPIVCVENSDKSRSGHFGSASNCSNGGLRIVVRGSYIKPSRLGRRREEETLLLLLLEKKTTTPTAVAAATAIVMRM